MAVSLVSLPEEITLTFFSYLNWKELVKCRQVCSHWKTLSLDDLLWKGTAGNLGIRREDNFYSQFRKRFIQIQNKVRNVGENLLYLKESCSSPQSNSFFNGSSFEIRNQHRALRGALRDQLINCLKLYPIDHIYYCKAKTIATSLETLIIDKQSEPCPYKMHFLIAWRLIQEKELTEALKYCEDWKCEFEKAAILHEILCLLYRDKNLDQALKVLQILDNLYSLAEDDCTFNGSYFLDQGYTLVIALACQNDNHEIIHRLVIRKSTLEKNLLKLQLNRSQLKSDYKAQKQSLYRSLCPRWLDDIRNYIIKHPEHGNPFTFIKLNLLLKQYNEAWKQITFIQKNEEKEQAVIILRNFFYHEEEEKELRKAKALLQGFEG